MSGEVPEGLIPDVREQMLYLQELGVELTSAFFEEDGRQETADGRQEIREARPVVMPEIVRTVVPEVRHERPAGSLLASLPSLKDRMAPRKIAPTAADVVLLPVEPEIVETVKAEVPEIITMPEPTETIEQIRVGIGSDCTRCKLSTLGRKQVVNSVGNFNADLMFVGEAPGADEDEKGEPFVGRAGQLLTDIIEKGLEIPRAEVFIGNINRCRPPGNRAPEPDETVQCKPFLLREIAVVRPKVIVVLGATAAQNLLETKVPISKLRGQFHDYHGTKVMPTFHPAYLLRDPHKKREVWEDMKMVRDLLAGK
ncbi:MAG TPA: uracil-DNA glycosylase [Pyrinomonadaceae bacterium]|mgnify:CR=1 FL=1|nr:uracil-DNA glycosylase [Pyrinomonadaceae bacterium]